MRHPVRMDTACLSAESDLLDHYDRLPGQPCGHCAGYLFGAGLLPASPKVHCSTENQGRKLNAASVSSVSDKNKGFPLSTCLASLRTVCARSGPKGPIRAYAVRKGTDMGCGKPPTFLRAPQTPARRYTSPALSSSAPEEKPVLLSSLHPLPRESSSHDKIC